MSWPPLCQVGKHMTDVAFAAAAAGDLEQLAQALELGAMTFKVTTKQDCAIEQGSGFRSCDEHCVLPSAAPEPRH